MSSIRVASIYYTFFIKIINEIASFPMVTTMHYFFHHDCTIFFFLSFYFRLLFRLFLYFALRALSLYLSLSLYLFSCKIFTTLYSGPSSTSHCVWVKLVNVYTICERVYRNFMIVAITIIVVMGMYALAWLRLIRTYWNKTKQQKTERIFASMEMWKQ